MTMRKPIDYAFGIISKQYFTPGYGQDTRAKEALLGYMFGPVAPAENIEADRVKWGDLAMPESITEVTPSTNPFAWGGIRGGSVAPAGGTAGEEGTSSGGAYRAVHIPEDPTKPVTKRPHRVHRIPAATFQDVAFTHALASMGLPIVPETPGHDAYGAYSTQPQVEQPEREDYDHKTIERMASKIKEHPVARAMGINDINNWKNTGMMQGKPVVVDPMYRGGASISGAMEAMTQGRETRGRTGFPGMRGEVAPGRRVSSDIQHVHDVPSEQLEQFIQKLPPVSAFDVWRDTHNKESWDSHRTRYARILDALKLFQDMKKNPKQSRIFDWDDSSPKRKVWPGGGILANANRRQDEIDRMIMWIAHIISNNGQEKARSIVMNTPIFINNFPDATERELMFTMGKNEAVQMYLHEADTPVQYSGTPTLVNYPFVFPEPAPTKGASYDPPSSSGRPPPGKFVVKSSAQWDLQEPAIAWPGGDKCCQEAKDKWIQQYVGHTSYPGPGLEHMTCEYFQEYLERKDAKDWEKVILQEWDDCSEGNMNAWQGNIEAGEPMDIAFQILKV